MPASIELIERLTSEAIWVRIDPTQLQQVILNIAINARDAMPDGGTLSITTAQQEGKALLSVEDTGVGISTIFVFFRVTGILICRSQSTT